MSTSYDQLINGDNAYVKRIEAAYVQQHGHPPSITDQAHNIWKLLREDATIEKVLRDIFGDNYAPAPPPPLGGAMFPPEAGRLHIEGTTFRTESGELWQWRGFSWFLGFLRFCRGEDVTPDLRWLRANGFNIVRVFGPLPWAETPDYRAEAFQFDRLGDFFRLLATHGLRCEFVPGCYAFPNFETFVQRCYDEARHWNVLVEGVNEPNVGDKPDPLTLDHVNRYDVLSAYGLYASYYRTPTVMPPALNYVTIHTTRDSAWHRKARHAQEVQHAIGKPCISDEPAKAIEENFSYPGGKRNPDEFVWHHAICALWTPGSTLHTEEGKWGRIPTHDMLQMRVVEAVRDSVWGEIDARWQTGHYAGSHMSSSPVDHIQDIWSYSSVHAGTALAVRCWRSRPTAVNGWRWTEAWGPADSIIKLER